MAVRNIWAKSGRTAGDDDRGTGRIRRLFGVLLDDPDTSELEILGNVLLPQPFHPFPLNFALKVVRREWQQDPAQPWSGVVVIEYASEYRKPDEAEPNPLLRAPTIEWTSEVIQEAITVDRNGNPIVTATKETYDPPPTRPVRLLVLNYTHNMQTGAVDAGSHYATYLDHVNETQWYGFKPETSYIADIRWEILSEAGVDYVRESLTIKIDQRTNTAVSEQGDPIDTVGIGWWLRPLHRGYYQISGGSRLLILDNAGRPTPTPLPLALDGSLLAVGGTPIIREHPIHELAEFNDLGLIF